jgi:hypothetical protein
MLSQKHYFKQQLSKPWWIEQVAAAGILLDFGRTGWGLAHAEACFGAAVTHTLAVQLT